MFPAMSQPEIIVRAEQRLAGAPLVISARTLALSLAASVGLAGCGGGNSSSDSSLAGSTRPAHISTAAPPSATDASTRTATKAQEEKVPTIDVELASSVPLEPISSHYTCDGSNVPPPLHWSKPPAGTVEQDLFVFSLNPAKNGKPTTVWAVAGLKPSVRRISSRLPSSAVVGSNSFGQARYSLCPPKGEKETYGVLLYALNRHIPVKRGFDADSLVEEKLVHIVAH